jgi:hypothetical protein
VYKIEQCIREYGLYIEEHRDNVSLVWQKLYKYLKDEFWLNDYTNSSITSLIKHHDKSKYNEEEFDAYRQYFYPVDNELEKDKELFDRGWNTHQKLNKHHWQYWVMVEGPNDLKALEIPFEYVIEMLCDLTAMRLKFNNNPI